jgi:hypothetical protein
MSKNYNVKVTWHMPDESPQDTVVPITATASAIALKVARRTVFADHPGAQIDKSEIVYDDEAPKSQPVTENAGNDPLPQPTEAQISDFATEKHKREPAKPKPAKVKPEPKAERPVPPAVARLLREIEATYGADFAQGLETVLMRPKPSAATQQMLAAITKKFAA